MELLEREVARARRYARPLSVLLGRCLEEDLRICDLLTQGWMAYTRDVDFGARLDVACWAMALPETERSGASIAAERFRQGLETLAQSAGRSGKLPLSLAVAIYPHHGTTAGSLIESADNLSRQSDSGVAVGEFPKEA